MSQTQNTATATPIIDHHPSQALLQNAKTNIGRTEYLVQTLSGLACLSQTSSDMEKTLAINFSIVCAIQYPNSRTICYKVYVQQPRFLCHIEHSEPYSPLYVLVSQSVDWLIAPPAYTRDLICAIMAGI